MSDQYAGKIKRTGEVPVEFFGTAVYKSSVLAGFLNGSETRILNMLRGELSQSIWDFRDPSDKQLNLSVTMKPDKHAHLKIVRSGDQVNAIFDIAMEGKLISVQSKVDYTKPKNKKKLEEAVQLQLHDQAIKVLDKTVHKWGVDCFNINNRVVSTFSTLKEWDAFNWRSRLKDMKYEVNITFILHQTGGQVGPALEGE
nr:Ger(x)C family spore germination C-terminal domain-containing protein [Paenibacillus castaneae]